MISAKLAIQIAIVLGALGVTPKLFASLSTDTEKQTYVMCRSNKIVRTIRVERDEKENSCITFYTKAGIDREVGRALKSSSCERIVDNIKGNLESAHWKCREVNRVSMTASENE